MSEHRSGPGSFCTALLLTRDGREAARFYQALFGWSAVPTAPAFHLFTLEGRAVAGMQDTWDGDALWVPCVSVPDAAAAADAAGARRATELARTAIDGVARVVTLRDPEGAVFGLWEPSPHRGAERFEEPGSLWWLEVLSNDVAGARDFYSALFGWRTRDTAFEPFASYVVFERDGQQEGGILPIDPDWGVRPRWNTIVAVDDCDRTMARNAALGGRTVHAHTVPVAGRIAVLSDPQGALFVVRGPVPAAP